MEPVLLRIALGTPGEHPFVWCSGHGLTLIWAGLARFSEIPLTERFGKAELTVAVSLVEDVTAGTTALELFPLQCDPR